MEILLPQCLTNRVHVVNGKSTGGIYGNEDYV